MSSLRAPVNTSVAGDIDDASRAWRGRAAAPGGQAAINRAVLINNAFHGAPSALSDGASEGASDGECGGVTPARPRALSCTFPVAA